MQTSKSRNGSSEVPNKTAPKTPRKLKIPTSDSDSVPSPSQASKTAKVVQRRSPRSPAEKKCHSKVSELESQLSEIQEELTRTKNQLLSSESAAKHAQEKLIDLSASEQNLTEKLETIQNQHSTDLNNLKLELAETLSLVESLKCQLSDREKSESVALELLSDTQVKLEIAKTVEENLKSEQIKAEEAYKSVCLELEKMKTIMEVENKGSEMLKSEFIEAKAEGEQLKSALNLAEKKSQEENIQSSLVIKRAHEQAEQMKTELAKREVELEKAKDEVEQLKSALVLAEKRCEEENIQSTLLIESAHEQAEQTKAELVESEVEMGAELERAKAEIEELKAKFVAIKENNNDFGGKDFEANMELKRLENEALVAREVEMGAELERAKAEIEELKANFVANKENSNDFGERDFEAKAELKKLENENEALKAEMERMEMERKREKGEAIALVESIRVSEREALMKIGYLTEEADKSNRKAVYVVEQLEAVQVTNGEIEAELRRLKVQSDQWRKAAEAAAAMISSGQSDKFVERTGSLDKGYNTIGAKLGSPLSEDLDDVLPKKKNGNMLRKLGVFLKKGQK